MTKKENFLKGLVKENPLFVLMLGTCPSLAITTSVYNAIGMGLAFIVVLILSNLFISLINYNEKIRNLIQPVRIAVYIVVIATLVTIVEMLMEAFFPTLYDSLGVFISLITVNCVVFGRAEAYACKAKPVDAIIDGAGMGIGYTIAILIIAFVREFFGSGTITIWENVVLDCTKLFSAIGITPISFFIQPAGAFLVFGIILAIMQAVHNHKELKAKEGLKKEVARS